MSSVEFAADWITSPDIAMLSNDALALHVAALSWCARHGTEGRIPPEEVGTLRPASGLAECIDDLLTAGHWGETGSGGYLVREWAEHTQ